MSATTAVDLVVGAGAAGTRVASRLADLGHRVQICSRSGTGPDDERIERITVDASDLEQLVASVARPDVIFNCASPAYHRWPADWPPIATALAGLAEHHDAGLVTLSNLYAYGNLSAYGATLGSITEQSPLTATGSKGGVRRWMWEDALARHRAGRLRATEARASDFCGFPLSSSSHFGRVAARLVAGKTARFVGDLDTPHSWTYLDDVAAAMCVLGYDDRAWGRPWHVPTDAPLSARELARRLCAAAEVETPRLAVVAPLALKAAGLFSPTVRELPETAYQFAAPFVVDSTAFTSTFGLAATPIDEGLLATAASLAS
jgi:nucleoside-diphosphate-sugar epimerase